MISLYWVFMQLRWKYLSEFSYNGKYAGIFIRIHYILLLFIFFVMGKFALLPISEKLLNYYILIENSNSTFISRRLLSYPRYLESLALQGIIV